MKYKVYRKKTNREDYIHYFSAHSDRVKSGVVIGFFLRAFRICSAQYLESEINHIFESFLKLKYPKAFIVRCLRKSKKIRSNARNARRDRSSHRVIVVPSSSKTSNIARSLKRAGVTVIEKTGSKIGDLIKQKEETKCQDSVVYKVPCGGCQRSYLGETYRGFKTRVQEHRRDIQNHKDTSSFVIHIDQHQHLPDWKRSEILWSGQGKTRRKLVESVVIENLPNINSKRGDFALSPILAQLIWGELSIKPRDVSS